MKSFAMRNLKKMAAIKSFSITLQWAGISGLFPRVPREIQKAVGLLLPGVLAKHAVSEGTKAVTKYTSSNHSLKRRKQYCILLTAYRLAIWAASKTLPMYVPGQYWVFR
eukprot:bmy_12219T0